MKKHTVDFTVVFNFLGGDLHVFLRKGGLPTGWGFEVVCELITHNDMRTLILDLPSYTVLPLPVGAPMSQSEILEVIHYLKDLTHLMLSTAEEEL